MITDVPALVLAGRTSPKEIAARFGQHVRHGHFLVNACRILGWMQVDTLTKEGIKVAASGNKERMRLARNAVVKTAIFSLLTESFGAEFMSNPDITKISDFLYEHAGLSRTTADRRASTIVAWMRFVNEPDQKLKLAAGKDVRGSRKQLVRPFVIEGRQFDVGYCGEKGEPTAVVANSLKYGLDHCLEKISKVRTKETVYLLIGKESDYLAFDIALRSEFKSLRGRVRLVELPQTKTTSYGEAVESFMNDDRKLLRLVKRTLRQQSSSAE